MTWMTHATASMTDIPQGKTFVIYLDSEIEAHC